MSNGAKRSKPRPKTDVSSSFIFRPDSNFNCILYTFCTATSSSKCRLCRSHKSQFETPNEIQASSPFRSYRLVTLYLELFDILVSHGFRCNTEPSAFRRKTAVADKLLAKVAQNEYWPLHDDIFHPPRMRRKSR